MTHNTGDINNQSIGVKEDDWEDIYNVRIMSGHREKKKKNRNKVEMKLKACDTNGEKVIKLYGGEKIWNMRSNSVP